jgi:mRNA interferase MazF
VAGRAHRFDVYLTTLDPIRGSEVAKTRPCAIVSPDEMNDTVRTVLLVPMSSTSRGYPFRVPVKFGGVSGELLTDHLRSVDKSRLVRRLGTLDARTADALLATLNVIFSR